MRWTWQICQPSGIALYQFASFILNVSLDITAIHHLFDPHWFTVENLHCRVCCGQNCNNAFIRARLEHAIEEWAVAEQNMFTLAVASVMDSTETVGYGPSYDPSYDTLVCPAYQTSQHLLHFPYTYWYFCVGVHGGPARFDGFPDAVLGKTHD